jgi:hypothetical protein
LLALAGVSGVMRKIVMRNSLIYLLIFSLVLVVGATAIWVNSYFPDKTGTNYEAMLEEILVYSNTAISPENYSCEGDPVKTVGSVVASLLELNNINSRNMLSFGCNDKVCTMSVSNCKPWQEQECGSRFLKFFLNEKNGIDVNSFECLDIP